MHGRGKNMGIKEQGLQDCVLDFIEYLVCAYLFIVYNNLFLAGFKLPFLEMMNAHPRLQITIFMLLRKGGHCLQFKWLMYTLLNAFHNCMCILVCTI